MQLKKLGITSVKISAVENEEEKKDLEKGKFSVVHGTPEAWLLNERWRSMLTNSTYSKNVCDIAVDEAFVETVPQLLKDFVASVLTNKQVVNLSECV